MVKPCSTLVHGEISLKSPVMSIICDPRNFTALSSTSLTFRMQRMNSRKSSEPLWSTSTSGHTRVTTRSPWLKIPHQFDITQPTNEITGDTMGVWEEYEEYKWMYRYITVYFIIYPTTCERLSKNEGGVHMFFFELGRWWTINRILGSQFSDIAPFLFNGSSILIILFACSCHILQYDLWSLLYLYETKQELFETSKSLTFRWPPSEQPSYDHATRRSPTSSK